MIRVPRTRASSQRSVVPQGPPHHRAARGRVRPMTTAREPETEPARLAELVAALSLGIDLGFGQPMEHVLRQCLIALRLADQMGLDDRERTTVYYTALLVNVGCHTDSYEQAKWFGDDLALRATKFDHEPKSVSEAATMVRMIGAGTSPLHRLRTGVELATSGRTAMANMLIMHARLAGQLADG